MGVMIGYIAGAIVQILQYLSSAEQLKMFFLWSMGSLGHVTTIKLFIMIPVVCIGTILSVYCIKALNLLLLVDSYAQTMGLNIRKARTLIFISPTLLTGTVTAFCGPVGSLGVAACGRNEEGFNVLFKTFFCCNINGHLLFLLSVGLCRASTVSKIAPLNIVLIKQCSDDIHNVCC